MISLSWSDEAHKYVRTSTLTKPIVDTTVQNTPAKIDVAKVPEKSIYKPESKVSTKPEIINVELKKALPDKPTGVITNKKGKIIDNTLIKTGQMTLDSRYDFLQKNYQKIY